MENTSAEAASEAYAEPLPIGSTRLLRAKRRSCLVYDGAVDFVLDCSLSIHALSDRRDYIALSHSWNEPEAANEPPS